jgi:hypothetical protein
MHPHLDLHHPSHRADPEMELRFWRILGLFHGAGHPLSCRYHDSDDHLTAFIFFGGTSLPYFHLAVKIRRQILRTGVSASIGTEVRCARTPSANRRA